MDNEDYRDDPIFYDEWTDDGSNLDINTVTFDLVSVNDSMLETKLKSVAVRINELDMHVQYQRYLDACDIENPPCEPIEVYRNAEAWFKESYVDAIKGYCRDYDVSYNLFDGFKNLYLQIYDLKRAEKAK